MFQPKSAVGILHSDFQYDDVTSKSTLQNRALQHRKQLDVGSVSIKDEKRIKTAMIEDK